MKLNQPWNIPWKLSVKSLDLLPGPAGGSGKIIIGLFFA